MIGKGDVFQHAKVSKWLDCGIPETFLSTNKALLKPSGLQLDGVTILNSQVEDSIVLWNAKVENEDVEHEIFFKDSSG